jgi:hypothetical protein
MAKLRDDDTTDPTEVPTERINHDKFKQVIADAWRASPSPHAAFGAVIAEIDKVVVDKADAPVCEELTRLYREILPGGSHGGYDMH